MIPSFTETFSRFLSDYAVSLTFIAMFLALMVFPLWEASRPVRPQAKAVMKKRWTTNFGLLLVNQVNLSWIISAATVVVAWLSAGNELGFIPGLDLGFWTTTLLALLAFELISYSFHRLLHTVPLLWRIHAVHHCDREIDFTTTFRNHPLEDLVVSPISIFIVVMLGFPLASVVFYQVIRALVLVFAHSNIKVPERLDKVLRLFITTPDYHRVHHSIDQHYTDSNFCPTFPIYDYLFGTAKRIPRKELPDTTLGLEYPSSPQETNFPGLLLLPFVWKKPDRTVESSTAASIQATPD